MTEIARSHLCKLEVQQPDGSWATNQSGVSLLYPGKWVERLRSRGKKGRLTITHADGSKEVLTSGMSCSCHPIQAAEIGTPAQGDVCPYCDDAHAGPFTGGCLL